MRPVRTRPAFAAALLTVAAAVCAVAHDPGNSGGLRLSGTEDARCWGRAPFSLSPDGRWLVFESDEDPSAPLFVFVDLTRMQRHPASPTAAAAALTREGRGPVPPACWDRDSKVAYWRGHGVSFAVAAGASDCELTPVKEAGCAPDPKPAPADARVRRISETRLVVEDSQATVLAEHAAQDVAASRVQIEFLARSPDGAFLSYVVAEQRGSFAAPARGYLLPLGPPAQPPRLLAAPIYGAPVWSPSGDLYACTGRGAPSAPQPAIVRWRMDRP